MNIQKNFKNLISHFLVILLCIFEILPATTSANYSETFSANNISITFGEPTWYDNNSYCKFPNLSLSTTNSTSINTIQISYSGDDTTNAEIVATSQTGFTADPDNTKIFLTFTTTQSISNIQTFLRNIKYSCNNYQSITILLSSSSIPSDTHYYPGTGHFYKYVSATGITWTDAYKEALNSTFNGWKGYLAVITSEGEDAFYKKYAANNGIVPLGWLGGTSYVISNMNTTSITVSEDKIGYWYWACGPESKFKPSNSNWTTSNGVDKNTIPSGNYGNSSSSNSIFYNKDKESDSPNNNLIVRYTYAPWADTQPDNAAEYASSFGGNSEGCLCTWNNSGLWNDLCPYSNNSVKGYTIEYGDRLWGNSTSLGGSVTASANIGKPVTIKYNYNNSKFTGGRSTDTVYYNTTISQSVELPTPSVTDYTFNGWYTSASGGTKVENSSNVATLLSNTYKSELNLYGQWHIDEDTTKPNIKSFNLTSNGSTYTPGAPTKNDVVAELTVEDPHVSGAIQSGIDIENYQISLDDGSHYYNANSNISGVAVDTRNETMLKFTVSSEGTYNLKVKVTDVKGNEAVSETKKIVIDKTAPNMSNLTVSPLYNGYSNTKTPLLSGTGETGCTIKVKEDNTELGTTTVNNGSWSVTLSSLSEGAHTVTVYQTDAASNVSTQSVDLNIDTVGPTGTITISENKFITFLKDITFGYFFKNNIEVQFEGTDKSGSGLQKLEYLVRTSEFDTKESAINAAGWTTITSGNTINIESPIDNYKDIIIYAKITDNANNVEIINSNGVVIYRDSAQSTAEINYTKTTKNDIDATVTLNGNTIKSIKNFTDSNQTLTKDTDYTISDNTITFKYSYLDSLLAGEYNLIIDYNPGGRTTFEVGDTPNTTSIKLTVQKATQSDITINGIKSEKIYNYGDSSLNLSISGGNGTGNVIYSSSDTNVAKIENSTVTILKVGEFTITATKSEDSNYNSKAVISDKITVNPKSVTIKNMKADSKIYDGNNQANINSTEAYIDGKISTDDLTIVNGQALFNDENVGNIKPVTFSGFKLSGTDVSNYNLANQPTSTEANITPKSVKIIGIKSENKVYDSTNTAQIIKDEATIDGVLESDRESLSFTGGIATFNNKNVGTGKTVTFSNFELSGTKASNYQLEEQPTSVAADITPEKLTIDLKIYNKQYDGLNTTSYEKEPELKGKFANDNVEFDKIGTATFESIDVEDGININFTEFSIKGLDKDNYTLIQPTNQKANIYNNFNPILDTEYQIIGTKGLDNWYISNVVNIVSKDADKYLISEGNTNESLWSTNLTYSDDTSGKDITFYVKNKNNNAISNAVVINYKKDIVKPTGTIKMGTNDFKTFLSNITFGIFFKETVDVKIEPNDSLSGILKTEYYKTEETISEDDIKNITSWTEGEEFSVNPDEKFIVYAKITDNAGNVGYFSSNGIVVAIEPVKITFSSNFDTDKWTSESDAQIEVTVSHDLPILDEINYKINDSELVSVTEKDADNHTTFIISNLPDGEYNIIINSKDKLNNSVQKIIPIKKDVVPPTINSVETSTNEYTNGEVIVTVEATDETSKLSEKAYSFDNGETWQEEKIKSYNSNTKINSGTIKVKDTCGNIATYNQEIEITNIDKLNPVKPIIEGVTGEEWQNHDVTLTVIAEDVESNSDYTQSGIDFFEYSIDRGNTFTKVNWDESHQFTITENGDYSEKIVARVTDKASNISELSDLYTVKLNKVYPIIDSVILDNDKFTNQTVKVTINAHDDTSGLEKKHIVLMVEFHGKQLTRKFLIKIV